MLGKVKKWLGIEGVKLEIHTAEDIDRSGGVVRGMLRFQSMNPQMVTGINVVMVERYSRGRGDNRITDDYLLGSIEMDDVFKVEPGEIIEKPFAIRFDLIKSEMDEFGERNPVYSGLAKFAKWTRKVKSEFRIEAEATVKGVALNPFDKKVINLT